MEYTRTHKRSKATRPSQTAQIGVTSLGTGVGVHTHTKTKRLTESKHSADYTDKTHSPVPGQPVPTPRKDAPDSWTQAAPHQSPDHHVWILDTGRNMAPLLTARHTVQTGSETRGATWHPSLLGTLYKLAPRHVAQHGTPPYCEAHCKNWLLDTARDMAPLLTGHTVQTCS